MPVPVPAREGAPGELAGYHLHTVADSYIAISDRATEVGLLRGSLADERQAVQPAIHTPKHAGLGVLW
jgi:hypothetical protein